MGWSSGLKAFSLGIASVKPGWLVAGGLVGWWMGVLVGIWF